MSAGVIERGVDEKLLSSVQSTTKIMISIIPIHIYRLLRNYIHYPLLCLMYNL